MILLKIDNTTGIGDFLLLETPNLIVGGGLEWYVTWNISPVPALPYDRSQGVWNGPFGVLMTPPIPVAPVQEWDIREVTVFNSNTVPIYIQIRWINGPNFTSLFSCILGPKHTLTYNAVPGRVSGWQIFDGAGILSSQ